MKFLFVLLSLFSSAALAGTAQGTVTKILSGPAFGSLVFITTSGPVTGAPACKTNGSYHFVFDLNAPSGKANLAMLMLAKSTNQAITMVGMGTCTKFADVEDLNTMLLE